MNHIFVGIDLADKTGVVRIAVNREEGVRKTFGNSRAGRQKFFKELRRQAEQAGAEVVMAYEASSQGFVLRDEAESEGMRCYVLAPTLMEKSRKHERNKDDKQDADWILEKLRGHVLAGNRLPAVWVPSREQRDDREVVRGRLDVMEKQTTVQRQIQTLLKRYGIEKPEGIGQGWTKRFVGWLKALTEEGQLGWGAQQSLQSLLRQYEFLMQEVEQMDRNVEVLSEQPRHQAIVTALKKEKGIGTLTAIAFRTELGYLGRFRRGRQVGAFAGLAPSRNETGEREDCKGHITHQGPPRLRQLMCQATWSRIGTDADERERYMAIVRRNPKKKKIALVASMRRLTVRLWHIGRIAEIEMQKVN